MFELKAKTFSCDSNKNIKFKDSDFGWFCVTGSRKKNQFCSFFHPRCGRFKSKKHEPVIIFNLWLSGKVFFSIRRFFSRTYFFVGVFFNRRRFCVDLIRSARGSCLDFQTSIGMNVAIILHFLCLPKIFLPPNRTRFGPLMGPGQKRGTIIWQKIKIRKKSPRCCHGHVTGSYRSLKGLLGGCISQRKNSCFPPISHGLKSRFCRDFSLYCIVCEQFWDLTDLVLSNGFHKCR